MAGCRVFFLCENFSSIERAVSGQPKLQFAEFLGMLQGPSVFMDSRGLGWEWGKAPWGDLSEQSWWEGVVMMDLDFFSVLSV